MFAWGRHEFGELGIGNIKKEALLRRTESKDVVIDEIVAPQSDASDKRSEVTDTVTGVAAAASTTSDVAVQDTIPADYKEAGSSNIDHSNEDIASAAAPNGDAGTDNNSVETGVSSPSAVQSDELDLLDDLLAKASVTDQVITDGKQHVVPAKAIIQDPLGAGTSQTEQQNIGGPDVTHNQSSETNPSMSAAGRGTTDLNAPWKPSAIVQPPVVDLEAKRREMTKHLWIPTPTSVRTTSIAGDVVAIDCGQFHSSCVTSNGKLYTWGNNAWGQCGHGLSEHQFEPKNVTGLHGKHVTAASCGRSHSVALAHGEVMAWGKAKFGQLGFGGKNWDQLNIRAVPMAKSIRVTQVAVGECHCLALTQTGEVLSWGRGKYGRLGLGSDQAQMHPQLITALSGRGIRQICCGYYHSMAITMMGDLFVWGCNNYSQLGTGNVAPLRLPTQLQFENNARFVQVAAGGFHSFVLTDQGEVYGWGNNQYGQLGTGDTEIRRMPTELMLFKMISAPATRAFRLYTGMFHSMVLTIDGKLYTFGDNRYGQLGHGDFDQREYPSRVYFEDDMSVAQASCGAWHSLVLRGKPDASQLVKLPPRTTYHPDAKQGPLTNTAMPGSSTSSSQSHRATKSESDAAPSGFFSVFALCTGSRPTANTSNGGGSDDDGGDDGDDDDRL
jgi:alpha-tubulin suppressor-like RCC1 family protein